MENRAVRIENISIENFKNVKKGSICLENKRKDYCASIVGIYGQNGSGKTALVDAIALLKIVLCGQQVPAKYADYINVDAETANLSYQFKMSFDKGVFDVWYEFGIRKTVDETAVNMQEDGHVLQQKTEIFDEVLSFAFSSKNEKIRKSPLIDTRSKGVFVPRSKWLELVGRDGEKNTDLLVTKRYVQTTSRCFIFSREMINTFRANCKNEKYMAVIEGLMTFGNKELFIINTENSGLISMNALPLAFKYKEKNTEAIGNFMLPLNSPATIPNDALGVVSKIIGNMNIVLEVIVPGLTIGINELGVVSFRDGKTGKTIQLMSMKNGKAIPFQYESEGIKKIVSILQLLIVVYNNPSITVAVDELDAGIFEYLLGELINIISEKGKGQLIFTSHNLRPLETIDKGFIAFTTTNPENRYIRMTNVKGNNNLRDFYYRDIVLGEQSVQVYNPTNNSEIALAFREAGESFGS
ncbi:AAA family ATPase [[Clostridium] aminophilum]|uniref:AAA family ATPase n=1 Tax=[Clostridium] aminophilum TaxID=1526 RepID=UPI003323FF24